MAGEPGEVVEPPVSEQATDEAEGAGDSAARQAVRTSAKLGLRICGMSLSSLLVNQIAMEGETNRIVAAYQHRAA